MATETRAEDEGTQLLQQILKGRRPVKNLEELLGPKSELGESDTAEEFLAHRNQAPCQRRGEDEQG